MNYQRGAMMLLTALGLMAVITWALYASGGRPVTLGIAIYETVLLGFTAAFDVVVFGILIPRRRAR